MKVDLEELHKAACEKMGEWCMVSVNPVVLLDLIRVARAAKAYVDLPFTGRRFDALAAALSDIEDSANG